MKESTILEGSGTGASPGGTPGEYGGRNGGGGVDVVEISTTLGSTGGARTMVGGSGSNLKSGTIGGKSSLVSTGLVGTWQANSTCFTTSSGTNLYLGRGCG